MISQIKGAGRGAGAALAFCTLPTNAAALIIARIDRRRMVRFIVPLLICLDRLAWAALVRRLITESGTTRENLGTHARGRTRQKRESTAAVKGGKPVRHVAEDTDVGSSTLAEAVGWDEMPDSATPMAIRRPQPPACRAPCRPAHPG